MSCHAIVSLDCVQSRSLNDQVRASLTVVSYPHHNGGAQLIRRFFLCSRRYGSISRISSSPATYRLLRRDISVQYLDPNFAYRL